MKVLMVGGGGREHALAWKLLQDDPSLEIISAPGNPGLAAIGRTAPVSATDIVALTELARRERPDLTIVGPEAPLAAGIVDAFRTELLRAMAARACSRRVDLPIPGSPPSSVTEPATRPPPSTRSSSPTPTGRGAHPSLSTSAMGRARLGGARA